MDTSGIGALGGAYGSGAFGGAFGQALGSGGGSGGLGGGGGGVSGGVGGMAGQGAASLHIPAPMGSSLTGYGQQLPLGAGGGGYGAPTQPPPSALDSPQVSDAMRCLASDGSPNVCGEQWAWGS